MNREMKVLFLTSLMIIAFSFSSSALAAPEIANYKLNGKEESVRINPRVDGSKVKIEINLSAPAKFDEIEICRTGIELSACDKTTRVKHYYTNTEVSLVTRDWNGKTSDTNNGVIVPDGDYKIKVTIEGDLLPRWLSPYIITIDSNYLGGSGGSSSSSSSQSQSSSSSDVASAETSPSFISTHSSAEDLSSSSKSSVRFEASSGRARLVYVGAPATFSGEAVIPKGSEGQNVKFVWSFGDGSSAEGKKVSHSYKFAGDYIVVLNASLSDISAVSRTSVKVASPSVAISNISGDSAEIWNKGIYEINLNGWIISNDRDKFIFPLDTIIAPNKKIAFPDEYMKLNLSQGGKVSLLNPSQKEISAFAYGGEGNSPSPSLAVNSSNFDNDPVVKKIREFIASGGKSSADGNIAPVSKKSLSIQVGEAPASPDEKPIAENKNVAFSENAETASSSTQTATIISSQVPPRGFARNLLGLPSVGFNFIKRMFYFGN